MSQQYYQFNLGGGNNPQRSPFGGLVGLVFGILVIIGIFWFVGQLYKLLWWAVPAVLLITAIIDYKVILGFVGMLGRTFRRNPVMGALATAVSVFTAPFSVWLLLGSALFGRKVKQMQSEMERREKGEYVDYEELDSTPMDLPNKQSLRDSDKLV